MWAAPPGPSDQAHSSRDDLGLSVAFGPQRLFGGVCECGRCNWDVGLGPELVVAERKVTTSHFNGDCLLPDVAWAIYRPLWKA